MLRDSESVVRRVLVELSKEDFTRLKGGGQFYAAIESFSVLQFLHSGPEGTSSIVRIRPKDPRLGFDSLTRLGGPRLQLLDRTDDTFTCLLMAGSTASTLRHMGLYPAGGYLVPPMEMEGDKARLTFVGNGREIGRFLDALRKLGVRHRTVSISDLRISPRSPLTVLTDKQLRVVSAAYQQGYYDRPRRTSSKALAQSLGLSSSTFVNHRLKAERRLLSVVLGQEPLARAARHG